MKQNIQQFNYLVDAFKSLPAVGHKTAIKWTYFILKQDDMYINTFTQRIVEAYKNIKKCEKCYNISLNNICDICASSLRDQTKLCILTSCEDLQRIEETDCYNGLYFILDEEVNIRNRNVTLKSLVRLKQYLYNNVDLKEIIIATNFNLSGELMAEKIMDLIKDNNKLIVYRIGFGLPLNSALDYADNETIKYALLNKNKLKG